MILTADTVGISTPEWDAQRERIRLSRTLLGGTSAMKRAGHLYLPKRVQEDDEEYVSRLRRSVLLNKYAMTVNYLAGQVFQKPVKYQEDEASSGAAYDKAFFEQFQEDVDTEGTDLSMFCEKVFRAAMPDGVCFVLSEYPAIRLERDENGATLYQDTEGAWRPRTAQADAENGWRPYLVLIRAEQVLDAWLDRVNGRSFLRVFRYRETSLRENADGTRDIVWRVRAISPDRIEVWESVDGKTYELVEQSANSLGVVPVDWFMPGEQMDNALGLTAIPALDDLAEMNRAHWAAYSDHIGLMQYGRAPAWLLKALMLPPSEPLVFGPNHYCYSDGESADIRSIGVDAASIDRSFQDLKAMEDYMGLYGMQLILPQNAGTTATQAQIAASSTDSTLKGWVQQLQDCMENALRKIAMWRNQEDGPALYINTEFRLPYDAAALQQISGMVEKNQLPLIVLYEALKKMGMISEDMTFDGYTAAIDEDQKRNAANMNTGYTPSFGNFPADGGQNTNTQQTAPGAAQG